MKAKPKDKKKEESKAAIKVELTRVRLQYKKLLTKYNDDYQKYVAINEELEKATIAIKDLQEWGDRVSEANKGMLANYTKQHEEVKAVFKQREVKLEAKLEVVKDTYMGVFLELIKIKAYD